jgi:hypothetical protein
MDKPEGVDFVALNGEVVLAGIERFNPFPRMKKK